MAQITTGIRSILSHPVIYELSQVIMGAKSGRKEFIEEFIKPKNGDHIVDIGCGTATILSALPPYISYSGYDISEIYISAAKEKFKNRGNFQCTEVNASTIQTIKPANIILMMGALHHMDDDVAKNLIKLLSTSLAIGGRLITIDPCYIDKQNPIAKFIISKDRGTNVRTPEDYQALTSTTFTKITGLIKHRSWIPYTHWVMECTN
jgi:SAM-dependent methyltransferase